MKKIYLFLAVLGTMGLMSCRQEADYVLNPNAKMNSDISKTFVGQFKIIWSAVNTGYNFWDVTPDTVDWDARYNELLPEFQALDDAVDENTRDGVVDVNIDEYSELLKSYKSLYERLTDGLRDGHMAIYAHDPYNRQFIVNTTNQEGEATKVYYSMTAKTFPLNAEVESRSYYHPSAYDEFASEFEERGLTVANSDHAMFLKLREELVSMQQEGKIVEMATYPDESPYYSYQTLSSMDGAPYYIYALYQMADGRQIPYFYMSAFVGIDVMKYYVEQVSSDTDETKIAFQKALAVLDKYRTACLTTDKSKLAGVILDLRGNGGGVADDLKYFAGSFIGGPQAFWEERHKEGMGRYDMSAWVPETLTPVENTDTKVNHRDMGAEDIPVVCLCDIRSVSCAEMTAQDIKALPTGRLIGERTHGGHGFLIYGIDQSYDYNYCGVLGDMELQNTNYFVYTSNFEARPIGEKCYEGYGITPDEEVLFNEWGLSGQFNAALQYIENYK